ncbi:type IV secretory system conjugative DNA transfer family protein [Cysteiniphilum litorale]|uniref:type IV secretory system conjugative DNA transfer family protein n=1 Tax=Cysteiniphilum litorale TaxID=2056700 RepID=UPI003F8834F8
MKFDGKFYLFISSALLFSQTVFAQTDDLYNTTVLHDNGQTQISGNAYSVMLNASASGAQENLPSARDMGIKSNALRSGQQYGYADQLQYLQKHILKEGNALDKIFNFTWLLSYASDGSPVVNVLPPVILKSNNYVQGDYQGKSISISDQYYQLYANARLVTAVPSWRSYLIHPVSAPEKIASWLLPHDSSEQAVWKEAFNTGWGLGVKQANQEMNYRISLLNRDFNGMLTYLHLYAEDKVSSPFIAYSQNSVSANNSKTKMSVNNHVYRITTPAQLNSDPNDWIFKPQLGLSAVNQH